MNLQENIRTALRSVKSNLTRAVLTMLIIATGIMALVGILTAIDSIIYSMTNNFSSMGANSFTINPSGSGISGNRDGRRSKRGEPISFKQAMKFKEKFEFPASVSISIDCTGQATLKYGSEKTNPNVRMEGIDENYLLAKGMGLSTGRQFTNSEVYNGDHKALIGETIIKKLFNGKNDKALGSVISVGNTKYKVVGLLESKGSGMGSDGDNKILIPLNNGKRYYGSAKKNYNITVDVLNT
ncbi:MAG: ABC transporter permease, partial [Bacteroidia bacterium]|nr:ABC transporter permease [Bacteroidia bacterium]